ncbi:cyclase family protein [candidate division KSB1 bacterium]|nr:cyclase family protein [candidate division KSB1 bacterium]RQW04317.1 MAG: cyclase family protein [candidate division KSB1 bacterium]
MTIYYSHILDLSHPICSTMPCWPGDPRTTIRAWATVAQDGYNMNQLTIAEHAGTHAGAPRHFSASGLAIDQVPVHDLVAPAVMIDMQAQAAMNRDFMLEVQDIIAWEEQFGLIKEGSIVLVKTGWSEFWRDEVAYWGADQGGLHFPGIATAAARFLATERRIIGLGIDTGGIDGGQAKDFAANRVLAEHNIYHLENLHLTPVLTPCLTLFIGVLAIKNGSGSPCRVLGLA